MKDNKKYLVTFEFRFMGLNRFKDDVSNKTETLTIGVFNDIKDAYIEGNKSLEFLESKYKLNENWNRKLRFKKGNHLISELGYLKTNFSFFAKITTLNHGLIDDVLGQINNSILEYKKYKSELENV